MMPRRTPFAALALLLGATVAGCGGSPAARPTPSAPVVTDDPALDAARTSFSAARSAALSQIAALTSAAAALDTLDAAAAKGAFDPAMRAQPAAVAKAAAARAALSKLPPGLAAYAASLKTLTAVAAEPAVSAVQATALRALVAAAKAEVGAESAVAAAESQGWSAYTQLAAAQALWLMRAADGFYPHTNDDTYDGQRAGEAYVVLVNPVRGALTAERTALAAETGTVNSARAATDAALTAAGSAFR